MIIRVTIFRLFFIISSDKRTNCLWPMLVAMQLYKSIYRFFNTFWIVCLKSEKGHIIHFIVAAFPAEVIL